jgi:hypothetical protein
VAKRKDIGTLQVRDISAIKPIQLELLMMSGVPLETC